MGRGNRRFCRVLPFKPLSPKIQPLKFQGERAFVRVTDCPGCAKRVILIDGFIICRRCKGVRQLGNAETIDLWPQSKQILLLLLAARPRPVQMKEIVEFVWPYVELQPVSAPNAAGVMLYQMRKLGFNIPASNRGRGGGFWTITEGVWSDLTSGEQCNNKIIRAKS